MTDTIGVCEHWGFVTTQHTLGVDQMELRPPNDRPSTTLVSATVIEAPWPQVVCIWMVSK